MIAIDDDKQKKFDDAVARFHEVAARDSETAQRFLSAKRNIIASLESKAKPAKGGFIRPVSQSQEFQDIFYPDGKFTAGPSILCYLDDAVRMYEKRKDQHAGETGLLFDPRAPHIKALRNLIAAYTESSARFAETSAEYKTAKTIEKALDEVQAARYIPKGKKPDGAMLSVYGYMSGDAVTVHGTGIVGRNYGKREGVGEYQRIEIDSGGLLPHFKESNAIAGLINHHIAERLDALNDISVITRDGNVMSFNYNVVGKDTGNHPHLSNLLNYGRGDDAGIQKVNALHNHQRSLGNTGIDMHVTQETVNIVENELLPYLAQQLPPLATIPPKQRSR